MRELHHAESSPAFPHQHALHVVSASKITTSD
jgi:hypothetical protein